MSRQEFLTGPPDRILCLLPYAKPTTALARLALKFPEIGVTFISVGTTERARHETTTDRPDNTILVTISVLPPSLNLAPQLKLVHFCCSGVDHIRHHPIYRDSSITLTTSCGMHGPQSAEWVIMTALVHAHRYNDLYESHQQQIWGDHAQFKSVRNMVGQRVGILGYGGIGRQVARVARAMGMDVIAFTATPKDTPEKRMDRGYVVPGTGDPDGSIPSEWHSGPEKRSLYSFLERDLDMVVLSLPLTPQSTHLFSAAEFEILARRNAFISNISRGPIIDQSALIDALHSWKIRGAALDVTDPEPLSSEIRRILYGGHQTSSSHHISVAW